MDKLVSVIIPTHDRKALTDKAVSSVVTSYPSLVEIIVVDDCGSCAYAFEAMNASDIQVRVIRLDKNVGPGMARQAGVAQASGAFIAYLDSDDRYERTWMDTVIAVLQATSGASRQRIVISGATQGGRSVAIITGKILTGIPHFLQLFASRMTATLFNPFYTPSLVLSKELCFFMVGLRHCEDYYSTAFALFSAKNIHVTPVVACHLGRAPNSEGGESSARKKMFQGELRVRVAMLKNPCVPLGFKLCVPVGMAYQWFRAAAKRMLRLTEWGGWQSWK